MRRLAGLIPSYKLYSLFQITHLVVMALAKLNEPWQLGKTLLECNERLLKEGPSDVTFRISHKERG